jgi:hypothetical protein
MRRIQKENPLSQLRQKIEERKRRKLVKMEGHISQDPDFRGSIVSASSNTVEQTYEVPYCSSSFWLFALKKRLYIIKNTFPKIHSWASASKLMPPASVFLHPTSHSGTGASWFWTGSPFSGTGLVPAPALVLIPVPDRPDAGQSGIYKNCRKDERCTPCTSILFEVDRNTPYTSIDACWWC